MRGVIPFLLIFLALPTYGQEWSGALGSGDPVRDNGSYYDRYSFELDVTRRVTIRMTSTAFDTYLIVRSPTGFEQINDDFDGQQVSQVELWATELGTWTIMASSYDSGEEGAYDLSVEKGAEATAETISGRLDFQDSVALKGEFFDTHSIEIPSDQTFLVELISLGFDGYLVATGPDGSVFRNDDAGSTRVSLIGPIQGGGKWRIDVTSVSEGETGAYDLRVITLPTR